LREREPETLKAGIKILKAEGCFQNAEAYFLFPKVKNLKTEVKIPKAEIEKQKENAGRVFFYQHFIGRNFYSKTIEGLSGRTVPVIFTFRCFSFQRSYDNHHSPGQRKRSNINRGHSQSKPQKNCQRNSG